MKDRLNSGNSGFTLVEMMIVVTIVAILASLAAPSFRNLIESQRIRSASSDLYFSLARARSEAIKRNTDISLSSIGGNWASGWQISHPTTAGSFIEEHPSVANITIAGPASVTYQRSGRIQGGGSVTLTLSGQVDSNKRCVYVDVSGRPVVKSC